MKKICSFSIYAGLLLFYTQVANAQQEKRADRQEDIIIRQHGDKDTKVTLEMKDGSFLINGKPLTEFRDSNLTVMKGDDMDFLGRDRFRMPRFKKDFFYNDENDGEPRPFLGVTTEKNEKGVRVNTVSKSSAAEKAGLKEGDIITRIGERTIAEPGDLTAAVMVYKPKDAVKIYYQRNGKATETKAVLGERKGNGIRSFSFQQKGMPPMAGDMLKDFKFEMPPMPREPFNNFWMPQNRRLGVKIEDTEDDNGAKISNVEEGSAAEKAGLKKEDIITEVDGEKVTNTDEVREKVQDIEKYKYTMKAKRGGTEMSFEIKIPKKLNSTDL